MKIIKRTQFDPDFEPVLLDWSRPSPVIGHDLLTAAEKGGELLSRARREASRIRKRGREVLAEAVAEKEEERRRGFEEGNRQGQEAWTQKMIEAEAVRERIIREAEPEMIRMVMEIAEKVIGRALENGAVVDVVKKTIAQSSGEKIMVRLHPSDVLFIRENEADLASVLSQTRSLTVKEDDTLTPGGCVVETELGVVDAKLETQLRAIRKALGLT